MKHCMRTFEAVAPLPAQRAKTHTCDLGPNHPEPHHCPVCGCWWTDGVVVTEGRSS